MDQQSSARWLETLKREKRCKEKWQGKYLSEEEMQREREEEKDALATYHQEQEARLPKRLTERDAMELRLGVFDGTEAEAAEEAPMADYELARLKVAQDVANSRPRNHRFTGDMSSESMLRDIGPGLWTSINPGYTSFRLSSSQHTTHAFNPKRGWGEKVDKKYHLKQDAFMAHADKCLQLGEKPFVSGGMKLSSGK